MNYLHLDADETKTVLAESVVLTSTGNPTHTVHAIRHRDEDKLLLISSAGSGILFDNNDAAYGGSVHEHARVAAATGLIDRAKRGTDVLSDLMKRLGYAGPLELDDVPQWQIDELNKVAAVGLEVYSSELENSRILHTLDFQGAVVHYAVRNIDGQPIVLVQCPLSDANLVILPAARE